MVLPLRLGRDRAVETVRMNEEPVDVDVHPPAGPDRVHLLVRPLTVPGVEVKVRV